MNTPERNDHLNPSEPSATPHASEQDAAVDVGTPSDELLRIQLLEQELNHTKDQMIRAMAEAENNRKRALREREDASKFAVSGFSKDILNVADNLRRALQSMPAELLETQPELKNLVSGIEMTERELLRAFEKHGIQKIEPLNEMFDANFHEVMFETPLPDRVPGTIFQVIEPGYVLNGRILRPARVGIAKASGQSTPPEAGQRIDTQA